MNPRKFIRIFNVVLISAVVGGGIFAAATMVDIKKDPDIGSMTVPFYGIHQAGIEEARQSNVTIVAFDINDGIDSLAMGRLMRVWSSDAAALTQGVSPIGDSQPEMTANPARLTIQFGFGYSLFKKLSIDAQWPIAEISIPKYSIDQLEGLWDGGDLVIRIAGDNPQSIGHAAQLLKRDALPFATVKWQQRGYVDPAGINQDSISRNVMGQIDGTANADIGSSKFNKIVWGNSNTSDPLLNGTTMVVRRIRINVDTWDELSSNNKGISVGRKIDNGEKLKPKEENSHVTRAKKNSTGIIRRGYNYDDNYLSNGVHDQGLIFVSFQHQLKSYLAIQKMLNSMDSLNRWTTPVGSALFIIPAGVQKGDYVGSSFFK
jgi:dye decolorizing peroxidase